MNDKDAHMKFEVGKKIIVEEYERNGPGTIEKVTAEYIFVRYPSEKELKKYFRSSRLTFVEFDSDKEMKQTKNSSKPINTYSPENNQHIPVLSVLSIDNIHSYQEMEERCNTDGALNKPGIYAWFFKETLLGIPDKATVCIKDGVIFKDKWKLRYIGKATGQSLKERVWDKHFNGSASVSTLRDALGSLLSEKLNLHYLKLSSSHKFNTEEKLTLWMKENARVYYYSTDDSSDVENVLINRHSKDLYLNLKDKNNKDEIFQPLKQLKKNLKSALSNKKSSKQAIKYYKEQAGKWKK